MRKHYLDYIRTFALMGVIVIHVSSVEIRKFDINSNHWLIAHFFDSISRVSVPLFFMLSGVFSFKTKVNNKNFIITRLKRLVIPLLFWASIYTIWNLIISDRNYTMLGIIKKIIIGPYVFHFWFVYTMIGLTLFIPVVNNWMIHKKKAAYFLICWFIVVLINPLIEIFTGLTPTIDLINFSGFFGYLVLGYYLEKYVVMTKFLFFISAITSFSIFGIFYLSLNNDNPYIFYDYLHPLIIIISAATFLFLKGLFMRINSNKFLFLIQTNSFGIYLLHILFLRNIFTEFNFTASNFNSLLYGIPIVAITCLFCCFIILILLQNSPLKKFIT
ncbi:hypothetical protein EQG68_11585 [Flavobacterium piscinae]|uniref:Acyltransferase 3 domain-containing protein n=2 Tax=Flavobacterium piscinae TaxID=2506424 RepID=A0A4Q1KN96_9FLAO|nr:acyltransferase family protein [Flavobacterium piscinae]RXR30689.1 hypothetical protein EQG68_11585 [Flavobacterium piscinae]